mgnify:FL=1
MKAGKYETEALERRRDQLKSWLPYPGLTPLEAAELDRIVAKIGEPKPNEHARALAGPFAS